MAGLTRLVLNSASGALLLLVQIVIAFVFTPFVVTKLGNRDYGIWELLLGLIGYLGILDLGVTPAVVRFVAHAEGRDDLRDLGRVFNTCLVTMMLMGGAGFLVMLVAALWANGILGVEPGANVNGPLLFVLFGLSFAVNFIMAAFSSYLLGMQRHWIVNSSRILISLIQYGGLWWVLLQPEWSSVQLIAMCIVVIVASLVEMVIFAIAVFSGEHGVRIAPSQASWKFAREMFVFGAKNSLNMAASTLLGRGILFVIAHVVSVAAVAFYLIPNRLVSYATSVIAAIGFPMTPFFASIAGRSGIAGQRAMWFPLTRALQFIGVGLQLAVLWLGVQFLGLWMGESFAVNGRGTLLAISAASLFGCLAPNGNRVLISLGRHGRLATFSAIFSVIAVFAAVPLAHAFGLTGAALALAGFMAAQSTAEMILSCRALEIPIGEHLRSTLLRYTIPAAACCAAFALLRSYLPVSTYLGLALQGLAAGTVWAVAGIAFGFTGEDRGAVLSWLRNRQRKP